MEVVETTDHPNQRLAYNYDFTMYKSFPKMAIFYVSMAGTATSEGNNHDFTMYKSFPKMAIFYVSMAGTATSEGNNHVGH
jgi:hypothetical protein